MWPAQAVGRALQAFQLLLRNRAPNVIVGGMVTAAAVSLGCLNVTTKVATAAGALEPPHCHQYLYGCREGEWKVCEPKRSTSRQYRRRMLHAITSSAARDASTSSRVGCVEGLRRAASDVVCSSFRAPHAQLALPTHPRLENYTCLYQKKRYLSLCGGGH